MAANHIIRNYSYFSAFVGGTTGLFGAILGLASVITMTGGTAADLVFSMKWQIEMVMAIANVYNHDINNEEKNESMLPYCMPGRNK